VYGVSPEEFFMYLTIGLIILVPMSVRIYRYLMISRVRKQLRSRDSVP
jgi:hypothetical protein